MDRRHAVYIVVVIAAISGVLLAFVSEALLMVLETAVAGGLFVSSILLPLSVVVKWLIQRGGRWICGY